MKHLTGDTRVLVADGARALVLAMTATALFRTSGWNAPMNRTSRHARAGKRQAGGYDSLGRRSAMETTDWHKVAEDRFVQGIADDMAKDLQAGAFSNFILAAPAIAAGRSSARLLRAP